METSQQRVSQITVISTLQLLKVNSDEDVQKEAYCTFLGVTSVTCGDDAFQNASSLRSTPWHNVLFHTYSGAWGSVVVKALSG